jgi:hypothetical protein
MLITFFDQRTTRGLDFDVAQELVVSYMELLDRDTSAANWRSAVGNWAAFIRLERPTLHAAARRRSGGNEAYETATPSLAAGAGCERVTGDIPLRQD